MDDLISRQAAIKAFYIQSDDDGWWVGTAQDAETLLNGLPTAEKVGKWIEFESDEDKYDIIKCSCCKHTFTVDSCHWTDIGFVKDDFNYCPNCGARMEGEEEWVEK